MNSCQEGTEAAKTRPATEQAPPAPVSHDVTFAPPTAPPSPTTAPPVSETWYKRATSAISGGWFALRTRCPWFVDRVWPSMEPLSEEQVQRNTERFRERHQADISRVDAWEKMLPAIENEGFKAQTEELVASARVLYEAEHVRRQGIEARLTTTLGFVALASTIAMGVLGSRVDRGDGLSSPFVTGGTSLIILYMVTQLARAGFASISGLSRASYLVPSGKDLLVSRTANAAAAVRLARTYINCAFDHEKVNNQKLEQLAIAHEAAKNFLGALLLLTVAGTMAVVYKLSVAENIQLQ